MTAHRLFQKARNKKPARSTRGLRARHDRDRALKFDFVIFCLVLLVPRNPPIAVYVSKTGFLQLDGEGKEGPESRGASSLPPPLNFRASIRSALNSVPRCFWQM